jgi:hypothetical protein
MAKNKLISLALFVFSFFIPTIIKKLKRFQKTQANR